MSKWLLSAALVGGLMASQPAVRAQGAKETQPSASTRAEEIYVVRSVPVSFATPAEFCAEERTGFSGATVENRFTFRSTATQSTDGRMIDTNVQTVGNLHGCTGVTSDPTIFNYYAEGTLGNTPFKGSGKCFPREADSPERGVRTAGCVVDLSGLPSAYVGGLLTTNSLVLASRKLGLESDPPGYTQASIATIRLWRKRDAPSSATSQSNGSSKVEVSKASLVGTWRLMSFKGPNDKGEVIDKYGPNPVGFLTYTADGRVSVVIGASSRKPFTKFPVPAEESSAALGTFTAYAGTYTVASGKVTHHIEISLFPNVVNTDQVRSVTLEGDRLILRGGFLVGGVMYQPNNELVWERLKPETTNK